jgi:hypothetical protein
MICSLQPSRYGERVEDATVPVTLHEANDLATSLTAIMYICILVSLSLESP